MRQAERAIRTDKDECRATVPHSAFEGLLHDTLFIPVSALRENVIEAESGDIVMSVSLKEGNTTAGL